MATARRFLIARAAGAALAALVFVAGAAHAVAPSATYAAKPEQTGLAWRRIAFESTRDRVSIDGWWFDGKEGAPVVVLCPRGHGNMADLLVAVRELGTRGYSVMTFDYREFGPSGPGAADTLRELCFASRWVNDTEGAFRYARAQAGDRRVFAWGQDVGGWTALAAAARDRKLVDGVAVEGLFRTTNELLYHNGTSQIPGVLARHHQLIEVPDEPLAAVSRLLVPLHVVIAKKDVVTPPEWTQQVTRQSLSRIDQQILPQAGHDGAETTPGYWEALDGWMQMVARFPKAPDVGGSNP